MTRPSAKGRAGIALADFLLTLVILVLGGLVVQKGCQYADSRYRTICYKNQSEADKLLWRLASENGHELTRLAGGYIVSPPTGDAKMVLIFLPGRGENYPERIVANLREVGFAGRPICPIRDEDEVRTGPVIDYWYGAGRWWCLHHPLHN